MRNLRLAARALALGALALALVLLLAAGWPAAALAGRSLRWRAWSAQRWARSAARVLGLRIRVEGELPRAACLLVSNHLSYLDVLAYLSTLSTVLVSKAEVRHWPVLGPLARIGGTLFLERERKRDVLRVAEEIRAVLAQGVGVVIFPEGTSTAGAGVLAFRSALLEPAAALGLSVRYAAVRYATPAGEEPAHLAVAWWGDRPFLPHLLGVLRLTRIEATLAFGSEAIADPDRKALARKLERAVSARFVPMVAGVAGVAGEAGPPREERRRSDGVHR